MRDAGWDLHQSSVLLSAGLWPAVAGPSGRRQPSALSRLIAPSPIRGASGGGSSFDGGPKSCAQSLHRQGWKRAVLSPGAVMEGRDPSFAGAGGGEGVARRLCSDAAARAPRPASRPHRGHGFDAPPAGCQRGELLPLLRARSLTGRKVARPESRHWPTRALQLGPVAARLFSFGRPALGPQALLGRPKGPSRKAVASAPLRASSLPAPCHAFRYRLAG